MPNPFMPDWVSVGAIVRPVGGLALVNGGARYVITVIEFQLSPNPEERGGVYAISVNRLHVNGVPSIVGRDPREEVIFPLDAFVDNFRATGEWLDVQERVIGVGTTTPVSMTTSALRVGAQVHITGAQDPSLNGDFTITEMLETVSLASGNRDGFAIRLRHDLIDALRVGTDQPGIPTRLRDLYEAMFAPGIQSGFTPHPGPEGFQWAIDEPQASSHMSTWGDDPPHIDSLLERVTTQEISEGDLRTLFANPHLVQGLGEAERALLGDDVEEVALFNTVMTSGLLRAEGEHEEPVIETDRPIVQIERALLAVGLGSRPAVFVGEGQVWQLPAPNVGLWRTSWTHPNLAQEARAGQITLTHTRENDRVMRCTATWLIEHGVRQQPLDPRTSAGLPAQSNGGFAGVVSLGQVWEIPTPNGKSRRWAVSEINERAGRVRLMSEDMPGKRIYLTPAQILQLGTYAGDGLPRRTSYQRILEDDDE